MNTFISLLMIFPTKKDDVRYSSCSMVMENGYSFLSFNAGYLGGVMRN